MIQSWSNVCEKLDVQIAISRLSLVFQIEKRSSFSQTSSSPTPSVASMESACGPVTQHCVLTEKAKCPTPFDQECSLVGGPTRRCCWQPPDWPSPLCCTSWSQRGISAPGARWTRPWWEPKIQSTAQAGHRSRTQNSPAVGRTESYKLSSGIARGNKARVYTKKINPSSLIVGLPDPDPLACSLVPLELSTGRQSPSSQIPAECHFPNWSERIAWPFLRAEENGCFFMFLQLILVDSWPLKKLG